MAASVDVIRDPRAMQAKADALRAAGARIGVVPTMGYLHAGHLSLLDIAAQSCDVVVLTIFVNPTQFAPGEDLSAYPRDEANDVAKAAAHGCTVAFCPSVDAIYPAGHQTTVSVDTLTQPLCGASRPHHFGGVTSVVTALFHIVKPHIAVFGRKDYQQLAVVKRMVRDLHFDVEIQAGPIVREPDGLAMSSRNAYLSATEREQATVLYRAVQAIEAGFLAGQRDPRTLESLGRDIISGAPLAAIDYLHVLDADTLGEISALDSPAVCAMAVRFGAARLLDNCVLDPT